MLSANRERPTLWTCFAVFIAALALAVSVWTVYENRKHNRLSVRPVLVFEKCYAPGASRPYLGLYLKNDGAGIATNLDLQFILQIPMLENLSQVELDEAGREVGPLYALVRVIESLYPESPPMVRMDELSPVLPAGEARCLLGIIEYDKTWVETCEAVLEHMQITVTYQSVYQEQFSRVLSKQ